jgi:hypothetical protein
MPDSSFLRRALVADAIVCGVAGVVMAARADPLHELLHLPVTLLRAAGLFLIPYALELILLSRRSRLAGPAVWVIIATNVAWALASVLILLTGTLRLNAQGSALMLAQAVAVAAVAEIQFVGLRRASAVAS